MSFKPREIDSVEWQTENMDDDWAPFDETRCAQCETMIASYLIEDPDTGGDRFQFTPFWIMDADYKKLFCEDCMLDAEVEEKFQSASDALRPEALRASSTFDATRPE